MVSAAIASARVARQSRVAARMIMGQDHARAAQPGGIGHDISRRQADRSLVARILLDMNAARQAVDMRDYQPFRLFLVAAKAGHEKPPRRIVPVEKCR